MPGQRPAGAGGAVTSPTLQSDGTAAAPGYSFSGDTDTGLYRIGTDNVGFSAGGTLRWDYNTARILSTIPVTVNARITSTSDFLLNASGAYQFQNPADGQLVMRDSGGTNGIGFDVTTDGTLKVRNRAQNADAAITASTVTASTDLKVGTASVTVGVATGYKIARGSTALDGSNPTTVATGLTTVVSCAGTLLRSTAVSSGTAFLTHAAASGANVDWYGWVLAGTASAGTEVFEWVCVGT